MDFKRLIKENIDNPEELERLYRLDEKEFKNSFDEVFSENPDSIVLKVWDARLKYYKGKEKTKIRELFLIVILSLFGGLILEIPNIIKSLDKDVFFVRNFPIVILLILSIYFIIKNKIKKRMILVIAIAFIFSFMYINSLPDLDKSQTILLTHLHLPFFLWTFLGISFVGDCKDLRKRIEYIKYNGELLIYSGILLTCLIILSGLTVSLFYIIDIKIERFYMDYIAVFLIPAIPLIGTYLNEKRGFSGLTTFIAKIFLPVILITLVIYLLTMLILRKSPYLEREALITIDSMLLIVLAIAIFVISENGKNNALNFNDYFNFSLIAIAIIIDIIALSAVLFRLLQYGVTPNKVSVLILNLIMFANLLGILVYYIQFFRKRKERYSIEILVARYLSVYSIYAFIVSFFFPIIFSYR